MCYYSENKSLKYYQFNFNLMNKKIWYWIVGVIIVLVIIVVVMSTAGKSTTNNVSVTHTTAAVAQQSLHDLIGSGITQTCTFSIAATTATSSSMTGTIYTASENMYGDFVKTSSAGKVTSAHMIVISGEDYLWSDALSRGIKMPWSAANSTALAAKYGSIDMEQPATYSCTSWTPDQSKFIPPTDIQFIDISKYMQ
jgi:hypothetical protein